MITDYHLRDHVYIRGLTPVKLRLEIIYKWGISNRWSFYRRTPFVPVRHTEIGNRNVVQIVYNGFFFH